MKKKLETAVAIKMSFIIQRVNLQPGKMHFFAKADRDTGRGFRIINAVIGTNKRKVEATTKR